MLFLSPLSLDSLINNFSLYYFHVVQKATSKLQTLMPNQFFLAEIVCYLMLYMRKIETDYHSAR
ncbi:hypothetical protein DsansV1_C32g0223571 [Dioscorea sansibarensis]